MFSLFSSNITDIMSSGLLRGVNLFEYVQFIKISWSHFVGDLLFSLFSSPQKIIPDNFVITSAVILSPNSD
jgi:hypothetical protein